MDLEIPKFYVLKKEKRLGNWLDYLFILVNKKDKIQSLTS